MITATTRRAAPGWAPPVFLALCVPVVVDVLFGATQLTTIVALVPEILTYGIAALLVRGLARRRGAGLVPVVLLALAFAVLAECLIVQTSLAPLPGYADWGRAAGVNWPYLVWASGYEAGWGIVLGIALTDLVFPAHAGRSWPGPRGLLVLACLFVPGAALTSYHWTHVVVPELLRQPVYRPPLLTLVAAVVVAGLLFVLGLRAGRPAARDVRVPTPAVVGWGAAVAGALWFCLLLPGVTGVVAALPAALPVGLALLLAAIALRVLCRWSAAAGWTDRHRLAVVTGALAVSMTAGQLTNSFGTTADLVGKIVLNLAALGGLLLLWRRTNATPAR